MADCIDEAARGYCLLGVDQVVGALVVGGEERDERRAVDDLCIQRPGRAIGGFDLVAALRGVGSCQRFEGVLEVGGDRHSQRFGMDSGGERDAAHQQQ